jgi:hypothetical protein
LEGIPQGIGGATSQTPSTKKDTHAKTIRLLLRKPNQGNTKNYQRASPNYQNHPQIEEVVDEGTNAAPKTS